jgi:hypothetical protein
MNIKLFGVKAFHMQFIFNYKIYHYCVWVKLTEGPVLGGAGPNPVLSKICSVLLCVLEHVQSRVDNSSAGSQLFSVKSAVCCVYLNMYSQE